MKKRLTNSGMLIMVFLTLVFAEGEAIGQETRKLDPFTGIGVSISADITHNIGNQFEIVIEGPARDVADLRTKVEKGVLKLRYDNWKIKRSKLTIHITSRELDLLSISGSGKFRTEDAVSAERFSLSISGSGTAIIPELNCEGISVKISGSGDGVIEKGSAEEMGVKISGSGKLRAEHFEVEEFSTAISGSGSVRITVKDELEARISGSGSVYYHGTPRVNSSSSGSGKVRSL